MAIPVPTVTLVVATRSVPTHGNHWDIAQVSIANQKAPYGPHGLATCRPVDRTICISPKGSPYFPYSNSWGYKVERADWFSFSDPISRDAGSFVEIKGVDGGSSPSVVFDYRQAGTPQRLADDRDQFVVRYSCSSLMRTWVAHPVL